MYWIEPLPGDVSSNPYMVKKLKAGFLSYALNWTLPSGNKAAEARQSKAKRAKGTDDLQWVWLVSCWSYCLQTSWPCSGSTLVRLFACYSQPCHGCARFILAGIWSQGRLAPFPAPNTICISYFIGKKIDQEHKGIEISYNFLV